MDQIPSTQENVNTLIQFPYKDSIILNDKFNQENSIKKKLLFEGITPSNYIINSFSNLSESQINNTNSISAYINYSKLTKDQIIEQFEQRIQLYQKLEEYIRNNKCNFIKDDNDDDQFTNNDYINLIKSLKEGDKKLKELKNQSEMQYKECHDWLSGKLISPYHKFFIENKEFNKNKRLTLLKTLMVKEENYQKQNSQLDQSNLTVSKENISRYQNYLTYLNECFTSMNYQKLPDFQVVNIPRPFQTTSSYKLQLNFQFISTTLLKNETIIIKYQVKIHNFIGENKLKPFTLGNSLRTFINQQFDIEIAQVMPNSKNDIYIYIFKNKTLFSKEKLLATTIITSKVIEQLEQNPDNVKLTQQNLLCKGITQDESLYTLEISMTITNFHYKYEQRDFETIKSMQKYDIFATNF